MKTLSFCSAVLIFSIFLLAGCAKDQAFVKKDSFFSSELKCIRFETPGIQRRTAGENLLFTAAIAAPGGSAVYLLSDEFAKVRAGSMRDYIPDFGSLVIQKFANRLNQEMADFPPVKMVEQPVKEEPEEKCTVIEFKVKELVYGSVGLAKGTGFKSDTLASMKDPQGELLWRRDFVYTSRDFSREKDMDAIEAENGKLLREEFEFAAEQTVNDFFDHMKGKKTEVSEQ